MLFIKYKHTYISVLVEEILHYNFIHFLYMACSAWNDQNTYKLPIKR